MKITENEPVGIGAGVIAVITTVLAVAVAFGVDLSPEQTGAIIAAANAIILLAGAVVVRSKVTPEAKVVERLQGSSKVVVAGKANDRVGTGNVIRNLDEG